MKDAIALRNSVYFDTYELMGQTIKTAGSQAIKIKETV